MRHFMSRNDAEFAAKLSKKVVQVNFNQRNCDQDNKIENYRRRVGWFQTLFWYGTVLYMWDNPVSLVMTDSLDKRCIQS